MISKKTLLSSVISTVLVGTIPVLGYSALQPSNPLDPSYYQGRPAIEAINTASTSTVTRNDPYNPLHPTYAALAAGSRFMGTGIVASEQTSGPAYVDDQNPLHPFSRNVR
jgi:hypothetical protein